MKALPLIVPYPPVPLSPNARPHWAHRAKVKARYREACHAWAAEQLRWLGLSEYQVDAMFCGRVLVEVCAFRVGQQRVDKDNLIASLKAGIDGVAEVLRIDDVQFDFGAVEFERALRRDKQRVLLLFSPAPARARVCWW